MGIVGEKGWVYEPIVNLEMSGFLYASMINLTHTHTHRQPQPMGVCGNFAKTNGNPQCNYILQRLVPLRHKVYGLNRKTRDSCINLYIYLQCLWGLF